MRRGPDSLGAGALYAIANSAIAASQFLVSLLFAALVVPETFGIVAVFNSIFAALTLAVGLGASAFIQREFFRLEANDFRLLVSTAVKLLGASAIFLCVLIVCLPSGLFERISLSKGWLLFAALSAAAQAVYQLLLILVQTLGKTYAYLALVSFQLAALACAISFFFVLEDYRWPLAVLAQTAPQIVSGSLAIGILIARRYVDRHWSTRLALSSLKYSLPLVPHQLAGWGASMGDRLLIASFLGSQAVGIYSLAFQAAQALNLVSMSLNQAITPALFQEMSDRSAHSTSRHLIRRYIALVLVAAILIAMAGVFLLPLVAGAGYEGSSEYAPWLVCAFLCLALSRPGSNVLMFQGRTLEISAITVSAAVVSLFINVLLLSRIGLVGACLASVSSFALVYALTTWRTRV